MTSFKSLRQDAGILFLLFGCWLIGSTGQMMKNIPRHAGLFCLAGAVAVAGTLGALRWLQSRGAGQIGWGWIAAVVVLLAALYFVLYPISQRHILGPGSDSEDALRITASRLIHGQYPYYARTYLGNAISPMPGAVLLAVPFYLAGRVSLQNILWLSALAVFCARYFRLSATSVAFILIFVLGSASSLDAFAVGDDYVTNAWYVCVLLCLFIRTFESDAGGWRRPAAGILLGLALGSRPTFIVIPPLLLAYLLQRGRGTMAACRSVAFPVAVAVAVTLPFYLYDPRHFSPLHIRGKLDFLSPEAGNILTIALPLLAVASACAGFFIELTLARLYLLAGIAIAIITLTPAVAQAVMSGFGRAGWGLMDYSIPSATYVGLWALYRFEGKAPATL